MADADLTLDEVIKRFEGFKRDCELSMRDDPTEYNHGAATTWANAIKWLKLIPLR